MLAITLVMMPTGLVLADSNPFASAMRSMANAMADYADRRSWNSGGNTGNWGSSSWGGNREELTDLFILYSELPGVPPRSPASKTKLLDGVWIGRYGEIFMIRDGYCRLITGSFNLYEDGYLETSAAVMRIENKRTGDVREYLYAYKGKRMVMKDKHGNTLLYRRLRGPWP